MNLGSRGAGGRELEGGFGWSQSRDVETESDQLRRVRNWGDDGLRSCVAGGTGEVRSWSAEKNEVSGRIGLGQRGRGEERDQ